jgi:hypothetical protein
MIHLTTYTEEKNRQTDLVVLIVLSFFLLAIHKGSVIRAHLHFYILTILLFLLFLFGYDIYDKAMETRLSWKAHEQSVEGFAERRRTKFRDHPEPWRAFVSPTHSCPNVLVRKQDGKFYLYDTSLPDTMITNPVVFRTITDYMVFWKEQRRINGSPCPVAYLQQDLSNDQHYYEIELEKELREATLMDRLAKEVRFYLPDSVMKTGPTEAVEIEGMDQTSQKQGVWTTDKEKALRTQVGGYPVPMKDSASGIGVGITGVSVNPMDPNWGGGAYSKFLLDEGYFRHHPLR